MKRTWVQGGGLLFVSVAASCVALDWNFEGSAASSGNGASSSGNAGGGGSSTSSSSGITTASGSSSVTSGDGGAGTAASTSSISASSSGSGGASGCPVAGMVECVGLCVDLTIDGSNCGACGHSCQGQSCADSICTPVALASGLNTPWGLAVDSASIYWLSTNTPLVAKMPIGGSPNPSPVAAGANTLPGNLQGIALLGLDVFWTDYAGKAVRTAPVSGSGPTVDIFYPKVEPYSIAINASAVYWTDALGTIKRGSLKGGASPTTIGSNPPGLYAIVAEGADVYWTTPDGVGQTLADGTGVAGALVSGQIAPSALAVDATYVYWTSRTAGKVMKAPRLGGPPIEVASGQLCPGGIAVDADAVYWLTGTAEPSQNVCTGNAVMKYPKASVPGAMPVKLAAAAGDPGSIALDANSVYWEVPGTGVDGFILRTSK